MSGEHMPYVDESFKEELASLSHLLAPQQPSQKAELTMADVIQFLQSYEGSGKQTSALQMENDRLKRENQELQSKTEQLEAAVEKLEKIKTIQEDYETLVKIMNRARKLVLFEDDEHASPSFKMDRNGNLEKWPNNGKTPFLVMEKGFCHLSMTRILIYINVNIVQEAFFPQGLRISVPART